MTIGERIKVIRKSKKMNLDDFGAKIGVTGPAVSMMENGKASVTGRSIKSICSEFSVREEWLRTGKGSMKEEKPRDEFLAAELEKVITAGNEDFRKGLIAWLVRMPPERWKVLEEIALDLLKDIRNQSDTVPQEPKNVHDMTPDEIRAEVDRQLAEEAADREKGTGESSTGFLNVSGADYALGGK